MHQLLGPEFTEVVDPNNDTLYSLPAPDGPALTLCVYWPGQDILDGKREPSAIKEA